MVKKEGRKSVLARHINTLRRLLVEEDTNGVVARLKSMKYTFDQLDQAQCDYIESIQGNTNETEDETMKCETWFDDITRMYLQNVYKARTWLTQQGVGPPTVKVTPELSRSSQSSVSGLSTEFVTLFSLPRVDFPSFNGDPCDYQTFITTFDQVIGNVINDDQVK